MSVPAKLLRPVRIWLWCVAALVALMVIVGGATRLTESGLSITEWRPLLGAIPPLSDAAWQEAFAKYRTIPQYQLINKGMSLGEFQFIYWWEWSHRLLGRLIGFVFALPLAFFWWRGLIDRKLGRRLLGVLALGGVQGGIGWWMVASGLSERTSVAPYRLAVHLTVAVLIFAALVWLARSLRAPERALLEKPPRSTMVMAWLIALVALVQIFLGAIVAGLDAGLTFNTWPLIDGTFIPSRESLLAMEPAWRNLFENPLTAQFCHRMAAYTLFTLVMWHSWSCRHHALGLWPTAWSLAAVVSLQAAVGIFTLLHVVPLPLALLHQGGALLVVLVIVVRLEKISRLKTHPTPAPDRR